MHSTNEYSLSLSMRTRPSMHERNRDLQILASIFFSARLALSKFPGKKLSLVNEGDIPQRQFLSITALVPKGCASAIFVGGGLAVVYLARNSEHNTGLMGWGEGTVQLDAFGLHAGARIHTLSEGPPSSEFRVPS